MKTKLISTLKKDLLIIELPKWYKSFNYQKPLLEVRGDEPNLAEFLSLGRYELLGSPDEIKEDDAKELVQYLTRRDLTITPKNYSKGKDGRFEDITFTESLLSALEKEILWENPYAEPDKFIDGFDNPCYEWWHEAESHTFDRNRTLIFVKN